MDRTKTFLVILLFALLALIIFGLFWFFFLGPAAPVGLGWYFFSFAAGLSMVVLPCTLPLAFVIVPLSIGKGLKGFGIALMFGAGVAITLSMYGVVAALVGSVAIGTLGAPLELVKNWLYFVAGIFAYLFALGEIGLVKFRMPTYTGSAPAFIQKQQDYLKALLLGLFLGNIGVGCPHPATPVILTRIAASGDVFYGWLLFFVHAAGRVLPLLVLALLGILGVNALRWLVARKDKIERATGWGMVFVAAFILVLGLFTHDWWVYSGQHTLLESVTQEERFVGLIAQKIGAVAPHVHGIPTGTGLFDLPLWLGNWVLVGLWIVPFWWYYLLKKKEFAALAEAEKKTESSIMPMRFWLYAVFSLLLGVVFIYVLPDRFLYHSRAAVDHAQPKGNAGMTMGSMTKAHPPVVKREEGEVRRGIAVNLGVSPESPVVGATTTLDFFVNEKPSSTPVNLSQLEIEHTKLMHVIGVRSDLNEFFHIHPILNTGSSWLTAEHFFSTAGRYKVWSQIRKGGVDYTFGHPEIEVTGPVESEKKEVRFDRSVPVGEYRVDLKIGEPIPANHTHTLGFNIQTGNGERLALEDYLGAPMHLAIIKADLSEFMHIHPDDHGQDAMDHMGLNFLVPTAHAHGADETPAMLMHSEEDNQLNFSVTFPSPGLYRAFAQFRPRGSALPPDEALLATFWLSVVDGAAVTQVDSETQLPLPNPVIAVAISLVLMAGLSVGVRNYLKPRV